MGEIGAFVTALNRLNFKGCAPCLRSFVAIGLLRLRADSVPCIRNNDGWHHWITPTNASIVLSRWGKCTAIDTGLIRRHAGGFSGYFSSFIRFGSISILLFIMQWQSIQISPVHWDLVLRSSCTSFIPMLENLDGTCKHEISFLPTPAGAAVNFNVTQPSSYHLRPCVTEVIFEGWYLTNDQVCHPHLQYFRSQTFIGSYGIAYLLELFHQFLLQTKVVTVSRYPRDGA